MYKLRQPKARNEINNNPASRKQAGSQINCSIDKYLFWQLKNLEL
jgi:hypothetical protein